MADDNKESKNVQICVVQIRGRTGVNHKIKDTLTMLNLERKNNCVVVPTTPNYMGMLKKVKDFVTYGEASEETLKLLEKKRKLGKTYLLNPPKGGFERGGIKKSFNVGGVLGYRKEKINDLIKKMI